MPATLTASRVLAKQTPRIEYVKHELVPAEGAVIKAVRLKVTGLDGCQEPYAKADRGYFGVARIVTLMPTPLANPFHIVWDGDREMPGFTFDGWTGDAEQFEVIVFGK